MKLPILSLIIPLKVTLKNRFLLKRVKNIFDSFTHHNIEIVVVDSSSTYYSYFIEKSVANHKNINYQYLELNGIYSASKARNHGSQYAKGEYLLFYDVDLIVRDDFIEKVLKNIEALKKVSKKAFEIYPCCYLSEEKTKEIEQNSIEDADFEKIKERYLEGYNDEVLYLAVNTSTILVNREHFFDIGAYSELFKGHGYEDFELIHRLYMRYPIVDREDDYIMDFKTAFPLQYEGFRKYFSYYALPNFFKEIFTLHLWHPRPLTQKYYRHRKVNLEYFIEYLNSSLSQKLNQKYIDTTIVSYQDFVFNLLKEYGYDNKKFCGFEKLNSVAEAKKPKFSLKRKIRRRVLNFMDKF